MSARHAVLWWTSLNISQSEQTDRQTDTRPIRVRFRLDAASKSIINEVSRRNDHYYATADSTGRRYSLLSNTFEAATHANGTKLENGTDRKTYGRIATLLYVPLPYGITNTAEDYAVRNVVDFTSLHPVWLLILGLTLAYFDEAF